MSGIGRWVWKRYRVKHNLTLRFIIEYRPCTTNSSGFQTTYRQHQRYIYRTKDGIFPIQSILEDLCMDISQWYELGDHIFFIIYPNEKTR